MGEILVHPSRRLGCQAILSASWTEMLAECERTADAIRTLRGGLPASSDHPLMPVLDGILGVVETLRRDLDAAGNAEAIPSAQWAAMAECLALIAHKLAPIADLRAWRSEGV